mgnify:CR=1 FL=1
MPFVIIAAIAALTATVTLSGAPPARALTYDIVGTPIEKNAGRFLHNLFHEPKQSNPTTGTIKAWFALDTDPSNVNSYDSATGDLSAAFEIFQGENNPTVIGTALATGSGLTPAKLNDSDPDTIAGEISWDFDLGGTSHAFETYLNNAYGTSSPTGIVTGFYAQDYVTSSSGRTANSFENGSDGIFMTLWGADTLDSEASTGFSNPRLGVDVVFELQVSQTASGTDASAPIPAPAGLSLIGLGAVVLLGRRRRG